VATSFVGELFVRLTAIGGTGSPMHVSVYVNELAVWPV
jgi:hypothetical protein